MTEAPKQVLYAEAKPDSKIVAVVKHAVSKWLERVGPKGVENRFIKAHENVLATLDSEQRKAVFAKELESWQKAGKRWGIAATVIDIGLAAVGLRFSRIATINPEQAINTLAYGGFIYDRITLDKLKWLKKILIAPLHVGMPSNPAIEDRRNFINKRAQLLGNIGSLGILVTSGPGHWLAHMAARGKEQIGKLNAKRHNYVDSGKAAEHAAKLGKAVGDAAKGTANYIGYHPELIRTTMESIQDTKMKQQKAADAVLDKEYKDWTEHHKDKVYYEQSGIPMPSKEEYKKQKEADAKAKKANLEAEKRGSRKY